MTKNKSKLSIRKTLLLNVVSLCLCVAMLVGTTFAWFTDSIVSKNNIITSGNVDVELEYYTNGQWMSVTESTKLFDDNALWEPGYTAVVYLRVSNAGSLALKYRLGVNIVSETGSVNVLGEDFSLSDYIEFGAVNDVATVFESREAARDAVSDPLPLSQGYEHEKTLAAGSEPHYVALVVYMPEDVGNEANHAKDADPARIQLGVNLVATQNVGESDSFGTDYDADAALPSYSGNQEFKVNVAGKLNASNELTEDVTIGKSTDKASAVVPAGTPLKPGVTELVLTVKTVERSGNIEVNKGQASRSLDVHVEGLADGNTVPVFINLGVVMPTGLKSASVVLYHVENGTPVKMTSVDTLSAHNQFVYNSETGEVSLCLASFSEITAVVAVDNPWDGTIDTEWYNTTDTSFTINTEEQLAGLAAIVGGMATGITRDNFNGKTVTLDADLDLGGLVGRVWNPIGYYFTDDKNADGTKGDYYCTVYAFRGTFNGGNHTISNIYQSTWSMKGDDPYYDLSANQYYNDGMGLFGYVNNGTVTNLTVNNFQSDGEYSTTGCVAAYAAGTSNFTNITITNSNPRAYNVPNGGVVGYAYASDGNTSVFNFTNIKVDATNKISALWGSWDVGCGGILGRLNGNATANFTDCEVGAIIDVYNDVCGNYQYYQYRYSGMLIGTVGPDSDPTTGPEKVNFSGVKVYVGNWADYYYCEFEKNSLGSYTTDYQFSRVERNEINIDPATNLPYTQNVSPCQHQHTKNEDHMGVYLPFSQLYTGYGWGSSPVFDQEGTADGVEFINYFYTVTYMDGAGKNVLDVEYVTDGTRSSTKLWANEHTIKTSPLTENPGKQFVGWVNSNSEKETSITAGNYKNVLLYESWRNPYVIRFVDINGNIVYSEMWTADNQGLSQDPPNPPEIEGYVGSWEKGWENKLLNVTADVTIKPSYILKEYADEENHVHLDSTSNVKAAFEALEDGKSVIIGADLSANGKQDLGINGGIDYLCKITGKDTQSRLNINSFEFTCNFDHNANKAWHVFEVKNGATLTVSGGASGEGVMVVNFENIKSNVYLFDIDATGTVVLEAGLKFEINYPVSKEANVYGFKINGQVVSFEQYSGIYVDRTVEGKIIITVGVTTEINVQNLPNITK